MISSTTARPFGAPPTMKERFQSEKARVSESSATIEKLETIADSFMALDGTKFDQDDKPGSVAYGDDTTLVYATESPLGGYISFDYLKESGGKSEEYNIQMGLTGTMFTENVNGVKTEVYQDGKGLLTLMEVMSSLQPEKSEEPEKGEAPKKGDKPTKGGKPDKSEKPKKPGKPKKS